MVDGVVASTFTAVVPPQAATAMLAPVRAAFRTVVAVASAMVSADDGKQMLLERVGGLT